ncbi:hypothetical protein B0J13DRAFT_2004 [Dactylonectria estremocensis]|uniref:Uncharacterized protein n=1 Tax=Dactylonectria estremocensis TaxID=1079267 RepID=A0A9P9JD67_9HYPO|nr:hypothetical protein B0J13DRAFT_2004 [Dactylonectria estremocensis]
MPAQWHLFMDAVILGRAFASLKLWRWWLLYPACGLVPVGSVGNGSIELATGDYTRVLWKSQLLGDIQPSSNLKEGKATRQLPKAIDHDRVGSNKRHSAYDALTDPMRSKRKSPLLGQGNHYTLDLPTAGHITLSPRQGSRQLVGFPSSARNGSCPSGAANHPVSEPSIARTEVPPEPDDSTYSG